MDATEKVRAIDSPAATAAALAQLVHDALGSLDISVWLGKGDGQDMRLVAVRGTIAGSFVEQDAISLASVPSEMNEPVSVSDFAEEVRKKWPADFFARAKASLLVPLLSSGRLVGVLTVGADRSGRGLDREAREFLRVLAVHAASEFHKAELLESLVRTREAEAFQTFSTFLLHDLKNFASTLSLIAKNAVRHNANPDFQLDAFRSIFDTAEKMKRLCNGLRTFSTNLAANKKLDDVNEIVNALVREFEPNLATCLKLNLTPVPKIQIDRQEFSRVLQNLILNANEAYSQGPIEISTRSEDSGIVICVKDTGKGIPKEFIERGLFQPFHTTKGDGLGIGLFQSKKIVEAHHGSIEVESSEEKGTIVRIVLPILTGEINPRQLAPDVPAPDFPAGEPLRHAAAKN